MNGTEFARAFHADVVGPLLAAQAVAVGRLGTGSDVLGFDDTVSRDHDWGCRLTVLADDPGTVARVDRLLDRGLPEVYAGHAVRFALSQDPTVRHRVETATVVDFARTHLGVDATGELSPAAWLALTGQAVLQVVGGPVFADRTCGLGRLRRRLAWYPDDLWRHVLAAGWRRVGERLPFVGRAGGRGDDLGSRVLAARLVDDVVSLAFLVERTWAPYGKWRGTAFDRLPVAGRLTAPLRTALTAGDWPQREGGVCRALDIVLDVQRAVGLPAPRRATVPFHDRPFRTVDPEVPESLRAAVVAPAVRALPADLGAAGQWIDDVPLVVDAERRARLVEAALVAPVDGGRPVLGPDPEAT